MKNEKVKTGKALAKREEFTGQIKWISASPHGHPEGVVFDDGTFVKVPPHSVLDAKAFTVGAKLTGEGELLTEKPNRVFHHVTLRLAKKVIADDGGKPHERDALKEKHHADIERMKKTEKPAKPTTARGTIVAIGVKPKGEVDRLILDDGTSVHVPKEVELSSERIRIGDAVEVTGEGRSFAAMRFLKAKSVSDARGKELT